MELNTMQAKHDNDFTNELFLHNDLSNCAWSMRNAMRKKIEQKLSQSVHDEMMSFLIFTAFSLEAYVNFIGWKIFKNAWLDHDDLHSKIIRIIYVLELELCWDVRPLVSATQLSELRKTLANGKPDKLALKTSMQSIHNQTDVLVTPENVELWHDDVECLWNILKEAADINGNEFSAINH